MADPLLAGATFIGLRRVPLDRKLGCSAAARTLPDDETAGTKLKVCSRAARAGSDLRGIDVTGADRLQTFCYGRQRSARGDIGRRQTAHAWSVEHVKTGLMKKVARRPSPWIEPATR